MLICCAGNDLARCLNWGGGLYVLRDRGLPATLHDVEHAAVSLLDRWDVRIQNRHSPGEQPGSAKQRMSSLVARERPDGDQVSSLFVLSRAGAGKAARGG
jgi:diacylglycerol kinase (ATP)